MKTKFTTEEGFEISDMEYTQKFYERNLKEHGFLIDKECQNFYLLIDEFIDLNIGENVTMNGLIGFHEVTWKCKHLSENIVEYNLSEV